MRNINISTSGSRLTADAEYAMGLIMYAYHLKMYRISGTEALGALGDTPYDIAAKAEGDGAPTIDEFRQMLQGLLADRFKLKVHRETREMPVYELVVGKNGPKLKESAPDASRLQYLRVNGRNYRVTNSKATMDDVVTAIGNSFLDRPVARRNPTRTMSISSPPFRSDWASSWWRKRLWWKFWWWTT